MIVGKCFSYAFILLWIANPALSQHHYDHWVHRNATDTTIVKCWNDSLTMMSFPSGSMMGMMFPDSIYCRIDRMPMDSLHHVHDSTFMGWHRMQIGSDSIHFDMMNCDSGMSSHNMMQFMTNLLCYLHWDSLMTDSMHRHWHLTGVRGWNGSQWVTIPSVSIVGVDVMFTTTQVYSAFGLVGEPSSVVAMDDKEIHPLQFVLERNYPNPFNPTTMINFSVPRKAPVKLVIYDLLGQLVKTLADDELVPGNYQLVWNGTDQNGTHISSGMYFYKLESGSSVQTKKMILLK